MTARLRVRHADAQLAAIMHHATEGHVPLTFGPVVGGWVPTHWNPCAVRVTGERAGVTG